MRIGTAKVLEALGSSLSVSDKEIQDSLWHYYYDIDKTVSYLKSKYSNRPRYGLPSHQMTDKHAPKTAQPKKTKKNSRFDQAASVAATQKTTASGKHKLLSFHPITPEEDFCTRIVALG